MDSVQLATPQSVVVQPERRVNFDTATVLVVNNLVGQKQVRAILKEIPGRPVILWQGGDYRADYTMAQVNARLVELSSGPLPFVERV